MAILLLPRMGIPEEDKESAKRWMNTPEMMGRVKIIGSIENSIERDGGISGNQLVRERYKKIEKMSQSIGLWDKPLCFLKKIFPKPNSMISGRVVEAEAMRGGTRSPVAG